MQPSGETHRAIITRRLFLKGFICTTYTFLSVVVVSHGPIAQQVFLHNMGIGVRLQSLLSQTTDEKNRKDLLTSYRMLCSPDEMGDRFKFFSVHPKGHKQIPVGFKELG